MAGLADHIAFNQCTGVELHFQTDTHCVLNYCTLHRKGSLVDIVAKGSFKGTLQEVIAKLPPDRHISVLLTGKGVLLRKLTGPEREGGADAAFPGIKPDDFYFQQYDEEEVSFHSLVRRNLADRVIDAFRQSGKTIHIFSLGAFAAGHIIPQLNQYSDTFSFDGHVFTLTGDGAIAGYTYQAEAVQPFKIKLGVQQLDQNLVLAYAGAFQLLLYKSLDPVQAVIPEVNHNLLELAEEKKFKFRMAGILGGVFALLLINFMVLSYYTAKNNALAGTASRAKVNADSLQIIRRQSLEKEALLKKLAWNGGIPYAYLADQIGSSVPQTIGFKQVEMNEALKESTGTGQRERYLPGRIRISGEARDLQDLNNWIVLLRTKSWVRSVSLNRYEQAAGPDQKPAFELIINY